MSKVPEAISNELGHEPGTLPRAYTVPAALPTSRLSPVTFSAFAGRRQPGVFSSLCLKLTTEAPVWVWLLLGGIGEVGRRHRPLGHSLTGFEH